MCKDSHDLGEAVHLTDIQELKDLHLKAKASVHQDQHQVCHLGNVNHTVDVVVTLNYRQPTFLACKENKIVFKKI